MNSFKDNVYPSQGKKTQPTNQNHIPVHMKKFKVSKKQLFYLEDNCPCLATFVDKQMWDLAFIQQ